MKGMLKTPITMKPKNLLQSAIDLEFPDAPDFVSIPPQLTLEEYDRLNEMWRKIFPEDPKNRLEDWVHEEFVL